MKDIKHYANRVVPQHKQPNFIKWLSANLEAVSVSEKVMRSYDYEFDIDNATGVQLDMLGGIVGRQRLLNFQPSDGSSPYVDDEIYRILLKAKISINHWNGTIPSMYELWNNFFSEYKLFIKDNQDMTMTAYLEGLTPNFLFELIVHDYIIPRPEGVGFKLWIIDEYTVTEYTACAESIYISDYYIEEVEIPTDKTDYIVSAAAEYTSGYYIEENPVDEPAVSYIGGAASEYIQEVHTE